MSFHEYLDILWRRKWVIALTAIAAIAATYAFSTRLKPEYQAVAMVRISTATSGDTSWVSPELQYSDRLTNSYIALAQLDSMKQRLRQALNVERLPDITIDPLPNTELVQITASSDRPQLAADAANAVADIFYTRAWTNAPGAAEDSQAADSGAPQLPTSQIAVVQAAAVPDQASGPNLRTLYILGLLAGVGAGLGLGILFEALEPRLLTAAAIREATPLPIFGSIPALGGRPSGRPAIAADTSVQGEAFRRLTSAFIFENGLLNYAKGRPAGNRGGKKLLITSAQVRDGKSTVAANLARNCALAGWKTVLVDANLSNPQVHTLFGLGEQATGLQSVIACETEIWEVVHEIADCRNLSVVPAGSRPESAGQMLDRRRVADILDELASQFTLVILDGASLLGSSDSLIFASQVDSVYLVVRRAGTHKDALDKALVYLDHADAHIAGMAVINATPGEEDREFLRGPRRSG